MTKIVLIDDHVILRDALAEIIQSIDGYSVLFGANNGSHFIKMLDTENPPHIVIMDVTMPVMNGFETSSWIATHHPGIKVIALSMQHDERTVIRMLRNGAKGYLSKDTDVNELQRAMEEVLKKGIYINELFYKNMVHSISGNQEPSDELERQMAIELSEREKVFLRWLCTDKSYKEIAAEMFLSPRTIDGYRDSLFDKLKVASRIGLVLFAIRSEVAQL